MNVSVPPQPSLLPSSVQLALSAEQVQVPALEELHPVQVLRDRPAFVLQRQVRLPPPPIQKALVGPLLQGSPILPLAPYDEQVFLATHLFEEQYWPELQHWIVAPVQVFFTVQEEPSHFAVLVQHVPATLVLG